MYNLMCQTGHTKLLTLEHEMVGTKAGRLKLKKYFSEAERKHQAKNASKRWREKHSEEERVRHRGDRQRIVEWVNFIKNKPCMDCGQSFPPCVMDFDHRPGTEKIGSI